MDHNHHVWLGCDLLARPIPAHPTLDVNATHGNHTVAERRGPRRGDSPHVATAFLR